MAKNNQRLATEIGRLVFIAIIVIAAFLIAGLWGPNKRTLLGELDHFLGHDIFQPTHDIIIEKLTGEDASKRIITETRESGKQIKRLKKLQKPMGDTTKEDDRDIENLIEKNKQ